MSTLYQMLYGGFVPPPTTSVRRNNPDKDPNGKPAKVRKQQSSSRLAWFVEFNRERHLKKGAENKERVLAALIEHPGLNSRGLAQVMCCSTTMANSHLRSLVQEGRAYKARRNMPRGGMEILYFAVTK